MADVLAEALAPYVTSFYEVELRRTGDEAYSRGTWPVGADGKFNPLQSLALMRSYNEAYKLGLTDQEIANGIHKFAEEHKQNFGGYLNANSNPVAVAAESLAHALWQTGKISDHGDFWPSIVPDLKVGDAMAVNARNIAISDATKTYDYGGSSFADFVIDVAPLVVAGIATAGALGIGGLAAGAETGASLGSGISAGAGGTTGISAGAGGVTGVTGSVAGLSGGVLAPAATGGWLVGSNGLINGTGNVIGDAVLNNAGQSAIKSAVTGGDILEDAARGAAGGLISSSGVLNDVSAALTPSDAGQVATNAISRGVNAAGTAAVTGGDPVTAGLTSGIGNYVGGTVAETGAPPVVAGAAGGGAAGATGTALNGGDIANGLITGAAGGGASGLASQLGANSGVASGIGSIVGGVVGSELADDQTAAGPTPVGTPAPTPTPFAGMTFADMLPPEFVNVTRTTDWGSNRLATAGRI